MKILHSPSRAQLKHFDLQREIEARKFGEVAAQLTSRRVNFKVLQKIKRLPVCSILTLEAGSDALLFLSNLGAV